MTLVDFLLARFAEDGVALDAIEARQAAGEPGVTFLGVSLTGRLRAECEAKRRIVQACAEILSVDGWEYTDAPNLARDTLLALAQPYADHRDYDPAWAD